MNLRTLLLVLLLAGLATFVLANWSAFMAPTTLSLLVAEIKAPLGLIMLAISAVLIVLFFGYVAFQQAGIILEARRYAKELASHRELADKAEASRFTELRAYVEVELGRLDAHISEAQKESLARTDRMEQALTAKLTETANTLSAFVGEVDDKLDRVLKGFPER